MGLSEKQIKTGIDAVALSTPDIARARDLAGYPEPRMRERGYTTLLRTIVGQQVSVAAATSVWNKLEAHLGEGCPPTEVIKSEFDDLRACGLSRQKQGYARSLAELIVSGGLQVDNLPEDDEEAIAQLTMVKGIGRWSAEVYLLFAEGRPDIWPAGDLAVQAGIGKILGLEERPNEKETRALAENWSPHRGSIAILTWHCYNNVAL